MITLRNLSKLYGNKRVLNNINITFNEGCVYGIAGENGAGKTTLFSCLAGLEEHEGEVIFDKGVLKNVMGFLHTEPFFFSKITGLEYLRLLCTARNLPDPNFKEKNIFDLPLDQFAETYSTGMQKKLAITGILLQQNEVFILDEPFNGVDIQSNALITEIILQLKKLGKTVLLSSHIFSTLSEVCDSIYLLKNGEWYMTAEKNGFYKIEKEMQGVDIFEKIERLNLK